MGGGGGKKNLKKGINIFSNKGFLRGGTMLPGGGTQKKNFRAYALTFCFSPKQKHLGRPCYSLRTCMHFSCLDVSNYFGRLYQNVLRCGWEPRPEYSGALIGWILDSYIPWNCFLKFNEILGITKCAKTKIFFVICMK